MELRPKAYQNYNAAVACRPQRRSDAKPAQNTDKILRSALLSVQTNFTLAGWASDLLEINTPANLTRKSALSATGGSDINIILALLDGRTRDVPGDVAECGVFKGGSLASIALI